MKTIITISKFHQRDSIADLSRWKKDEQAGQYAHWNYIVWENRKKNNDKKWNMGSHQAIKTKRQYWKHQERSGSSCIIVLKADN